jgi:signal transduction histidine kinase
MQRPRRLQHAGPDRGDALVALGLWVATEIEVWGFWVEEEQGPKLFAAAMATGLAVAIAWRRGHPLAVVATVAALYAAWVVVDVPAGSLFPFLILLVAVYTVAERCDRRAAVAGGALGLAAIWLQIAVEGSEVANYAFTGVFVVGAWVAGRGMRRRQTRADHLQLRTVELERDREAKARAAVAEERARIARELHDVVAHSVGVMVIQAQAAQQVAPPDAATQPALRSIESTGQQALTEMRRLLGLLRSEDEEVALAPQPSLRFLDRLVDQVREAGLPVELVVEGHPARLPPGVDLSGYRIVQEALTNALKHAGPARARVLVRYGATELELEISDDGPGGATAAGNGHGLVGMRERVSVYGGRLETGGRPDGGYAVRVRLPLEPGRP